MAGQGYCSKLAAPRVSAGLYRVLDVDLASTYVEVIKQGDCLMVWTLNTDKVQDIDEFRAEKGGAMWLRLYENS